MPQSAETENFITYHELFIDANARAFTPTASESGYNSGKYGTLTEQSMGDWSWKPYRYDNKSRYRLLVTGPKCQCTLTQPVGTRCARHQPRVVPAAEVRLAA